MPSDVLRGPDWAVPLRDLLTLEPAPPASWMTRHTRLVKRDTYSSVGFLQLRGQTCFLKLYLARSGWQRLAFRLGLARGVRSFDAANRLAAAGLAVPLPRCCLLVPGGMLLLTEAIEGGADLRTLWLSDGAVGERASYLRSAAETLAGLHGAGFAHGDCKWDNLLWSGEGFYLVDLEAVSWQRSGRAGWPGLRRAQLRDLARFTVDAEELGASPQQYRSFLERYCELTGQFQPGLVAAIGPRAATFRRRHRERYGRIAEPLL